MKAEELPGTPGIWLDFLNSASPLLPVPSGMEALARHARLLHAQWTGDENRLLTAAFGTAGSVPVSKNIQRLSSGASVAVIADLYPVLFGGPLSQILKCLTAVKVCEELDKKSVSAVPVGWVSPDPPCGFPRWSITLLDPAAEIHLIETAPFEVIPRDRIAALISRVGEIGQGLFDPEMLVILRDAFSQGEFLDSACVRLFNALMREPGMIMLNHSAPECRQVITEAVESLGTRITGIESIIRMQKSRLAEEGYADPFSSDGIPLPLIQATVLPVLAHVTDAADVYRIAEASGIFDQSGTTKPLAFPRLSATMGDSKIRKIFARHGLELSRLYAPEEELLQTVTNSLPKEIPAKFEALQAEVERQIARLNSQESGLSEAAAESKEKITYQLEKLRDSALKALRSKEQTARRQIRRACNSLAPNGIPQETQLAGIQVPLNYSLAGLRHLRENLNLSDFGHQLIWMD